MLKSINLIKHIINRKQTFDFRVISRLICGSTSLQHKSVYLIDEQEEHKRINEVNKYTQRTFNCGELRIQHSGENVTLCGWLEFQRMQHKFLVLRDAYGATQLLIDDKNEALRASVATCALESILKVQGVVQARPAAMINQRQATGEIEVLVSDLQILNPADKVLPFNLREFQKAKEHLRMKYRYLDIRFSEMQRNLRFRSHICFKLREFLIKHCGFVDVETPTLFKPTPGGAQEFIVPTQYENEFYSLVQSPQQFKQMLMAGAIDRYFQIARCYRDETSRPDRQPEFTQLDIEMSFVQRENVMQLSEDLLRYCWPPHLPELPSQIPRFTYKQAFEQYGSDKPDTRMDYKIINCSEHFTHGETKKFFAGALVFPQVNNLTKSLKESLLKQHFGALKVYAIKVTSKEDCLMKLTKISGFGSLKFIDNLEISEESLIFFAYGDYDVVLKQLGKMRLDYVNYLEQHEHKIRNNLGVAWIYDFPLFEENDLGGFASVHHPFTAPHPHDMHLLETSPLEMRSQSYDLVLNGQEIAGGSIRIHDANMQTRILDMLRIDKDALKHIIEMLRSGCPPHGGIAFGIDRFIAVLLDTQSIRDVIAFPKTHEGRDLLSGAPTHILEATKQLYHIK